MYLEWIEIKNYRNLDGTKMHFHQDLNYFVGENAVGKSNFLDLLYTMSHGRGFEEEDFTSLDRPIVIRLGLAPETGYGKLAKSITIRIEQGIEDVYPRVYKKEKQGWQPIGLGDLRHVMYIYHKESAEYALYELEPSIFDAMGQTFIERLPADVRQRIETDSNFHGNLSNSGMSRRSSVKHLMDYLELTLREELEARYSQDNVRLFLSVALSILVEMYMKFQKRTTSAERLVTKDEQGRRYLPIFISVDKPEMHLSPYLQRSLLSYYHGIITNRNPSFLKLIKVLFDLDGLEGQLFIITHSTDALVDDYRHIIRLYRNKDGQVQAACGVTFHFSKDLEKHLIMHFPEAKEALYAKSIILVEGETEYGAFRQFGLCLGVDFDYFGICLLNARGESSIAKLMKLFTSFAIPVMALYDRDVKAKYGSHVKNIFYTDEICFEMEVVSYVIYKGGRDYLNRIIKELTGGRGGVVTRDMLRRSLEKLGLDYHAYEPRSLQQIGDGEDNLLRIYYFAWFYANKGIYVGRVIAQFLPAHLLPPSFKQLILMAKGQSLH